MRSGHHAFLNGVLKPRSTLAARSEKWRLSALATPQMFSILGFDVCRIRVFGGVEPDASLECDLDKASPAG